MPFPHRPVLPAARTPPPFYHPKHASDKTKLLSEVSALEAVINLATDRIQTATPQEQTPLRGTNGDGNKGDREGGDGSGDGSDGEGCVAREQEARECVDAKMGLKEEGDQEGEVCLWMCHGFSSSIGLL